MAPRDLLRPFFFVGIAALFSSSCLAQNAIVHDECLSDLTQLFNLEKDADTQIHRTYKLCKSTNYRAGKINHNFNFVGESLQVKSNLHVKCDEDGDMADDCVVKDGHLHIDGTEYFGSDEPAYNVVFEGLTFQNTYKYSFWGTKPGNITFVNCNFAEHKKAKGIILLDYSNEENLGGELVLNFHNCEFMLNTYAGGGALPSIITVNGKHNKVNIRNSIFSYNNFQFNNTQVETNSFLIESSGSLSVQDSCFYNNGVGVSPIASYGSIAELSLSSNFGERSDGGKCDFSSEFRTNDAFLDFSPTCQTYDATACTALAVPAQTTAPTVAPTAAPTAAPTVAPTAAPTVAPTAAPTAAPTGVPTVAPTAAPTAAPTPAPTTPSTPESSDSDGDVTIVRPSPTATPTKVPLYKKYRTPGSDRYRIFDRFSKNHPWDNFGEGGGF